VVFTNGCFDLLHEGHLEVLERARALGDHLVVGLNSDASVRALKGPDRPVLPASERARLLTALDTVDLVVVFDAPTPAGLIAQLGPDVLVKGADWTEADIVGADLVRRRGGSVARIPLVPGHSTSALLARIRGKNPSGEGA
jgi:D-beta-D-heptose 7-phosphate kinase/D-beta-D-heptose 1-phosphate adenosyltransferase